MTPMLSTEKVRSIIVNCFAFLAILLASDNKFPVTLYIIQVPTATYPYIKVVTSNMMVLKNRAGKIVRFRLNSLKNHTLKHNIETSLKKPTVDNKKEEKQNLFLG